MSTKQHLINTVGELADYLQREGLSPEELAGRVNISNMTLRRLLKRSRRTALPEKYRCLLTIALQPAAGVPVAPSKALQKNFDSLLTELEENGAKCEDVASLRKEVTGKLSLAKLGEEFKTLAMGLFRHLTAKEGARRRALAIGALLYFLNPVDAIPDALPGIGYLDDFAVLTLVTGMLTRDHEPGSAEA